MGLKLHSAVNGTSPDKELIWLTTDEKINLSGYALVDRTFKSDGEISNEFRHIFIFPNIELNSGDWVCLYNGKGEYTTRPYQHNTTKKVHKLYWGADHCVWNDEGGDRATLISYKVIDGMDVPAVKK